ncbi:MAG: NAD+ synthase [Rhodospirillaceae bacterium]|nr:NAD+ synthase [Rhodospirillaceae bacterium]|tara:strand:+ start:3123 stop:4793 length:1671 start_codon:yes stop_codon:yes gene_type:complete
MKESFSTYLCQLNPIVGNISYNLSLVRKSWEEAKRLGADVLITSELVVSGYPPDDLILRPSFTEKIEEEVKKFIESIGSNGPAIILGTPWVAKGNMYNAALVIDHGKIIGMSLKNNLPNYGVFDEERFFVSSKSNSLINIRGVNCGVLVCEDMWTAEVCKSLFEAGAQILIVINASPFDIKKLYDREKIASMRVNETNLPLIYVNQLGGQDELVFDGNSFVLNQNGNKIVSLSGWQSNSKLVCWKKEINGKLLNFSDNLNYELNANQEVYSALVLGLKDYINKNGFKGVIIGMSGGIDSALTACIATDALGSEKVHCVMMPSIYTSNESLTDAKECSDLLGVKYSVINIKNILNEYTNIFNKIFSGLEEDETEENIQSRVRGAILMAMSNKFGDMVIATGNKSEMSVGYATLYGDMCGGFSVLKDVYKTVVFKIAAWRNENFLEFFKGKKCEVIPKNIISKPPTAELKLNQFDQDKLPEYDILDAILINLIEKEMSLDQIISDGFDRNTVIQVYKLLKIAEYKRWQSPPGIKITNKSFGRERRYPITNQFFEKVLN